MKVYPLHTAGGNATAVLGTLMRIAALLPCLWIFMPNVCAARELDVGPGKPLASIMQAVAAAHAGDVIRIWPRADGRPYTKVAVEMDKPRITIESALRRRAIRVSGTGFNYSGRGAIPRAVFQFNRGASGCVLRGLNISGAHNHAGNGAGVRINSANNITISHCTIHGNDMGIMSNGNLNSHSGADQRIEFCHITRNGTTNHAGYNHNLYLGGTSALILGCDISHSLTGHNIKSRCHITWIEYCYVHDSANREIDLVDDRVNTGAARSDAVIIGCLIVKSPHTSGNHEVIHFGQDGGGPHNGTLFLVHNSIRTPYPSPVVVLSSKGSKLVCLDNKITGPASYGIFLQVTHGARATRASGSGNLLSRGYGKEMQLLGGKLVHWNAIKRLLPWHAAQIQVAPLQRMDRGHLRIWRHAAAGANWR